MVGRPSHSPAEEEEFGHVAEIETSALANHGQQQSLLPVLLLSESRARRCSHGPHWCGRSRRWCWAAPTDQFGSICVLPAHKLSCRSDRSRKVYTLFFSPTCVSSLSGTGLHDPNHRIWDDCMFGIRTGLHSWEMVTLTVTGLDHSAQGYISISSSNCPIFSELWASIASELGVDVATGARLVREGARLQVVGQCGRVEIRAYRCGSLVWLR